MRDPMNQYDCPEADIPAAEDSTDQHIIDRLFARSEEGLTLLQTRYGKLCYRIALNLLGNREDAEECVNDAYLAVWNTIPPKQPSCLRLFLAKITRNLSINRLRERKAKRRDRDMTLSLEELEGVLSIPEDKSEGLSELISEFLRSLEREDRLLFMGRYWHGQSVKELADRMGLSANAAAVRLHRIREELRDYLTDKGVTV